MKLNVRHESWPLREPFRISNAVYYSSELIVVTVRDDNGFEGRGEAAGVDYRAETIATMTGQLSALGERLAADQSTLDALLPPGGARNALDCALWDLEAKRSGLRAWELAGYAELAALPSFVTIGLGTPEAMAAAARAVAGDRIKLKLGGSADREILERVSAARPEAVLIVDPNQAWSLDRLAAMLPALHAAGVALIEQPLSAHAEQDLRSFDAGIPICADESCQTEEDLEKLVGLYDVVNIKLDKCGGLTSALSLKKRALSLGFEIMVGCNDATSLGIAPAAIVAQDCAVVDLDWHLLNRSDRPFGFPRGAPLLPPFQAELWG